MLTCMWGDEEVPEPILEGRTLLDGFYGFSRADDPDRFILGQAFRQDAYRVIVIQTHLAIEELLRSFLFEKLTADPDPGTFTYKQNVAFVSEMRTREVLDLAARLHVLTARGYEELTKLNTIRNKCSHNWGLHSFSVAEKLRDDEDEKAPYIDFNGKNLVTPAVMNEDFIPLYSAVYLELWSIHYGVAPEARLYTDETLQAVRAL